MHKGLLETVCKVPAAFTFRQHACAALCLSGVPCYNMFSVLCRLLVRLDMYALQEREVAGDGNCQVSSCWPENGTGVVWTQA